MRVSGDSSPPGDRALQENRGENEIMERPRFLTGEWKKKEE